jgi:hypothetical protein
MDYSALEDPVRRRARETYHTTGAHGGHGGCGSRYPTTGRRHYRAARHTVPAPLALSGTFITTRSADRANRRMSEDGDITRPGQKRKEAFVSRLVTNLDQSNFTRIANDQPEMRREARLSVGSKRMRRRQGWFLCHYSRSDHREASQPVPVKHYGRPAHDQENTVTHAHKETARLSVCDSRRKRRELFLQQC